MSTKHPTPADLAIDELSPPTTAGAASGPGAPRAVPADAGESSALEEMRSIRARYAQGNASELDLQRYRALWVALSLRRSPQGREALRPDVLAALARFRRSREALEHERARVAIEAVFDPEDEAMFGPEDEIVFDPEDGVAVVHHDALVESYDALVADLAATLDLDTGAADTTHPSTYTALTTDLAGTLDLHAGLAAVLGPTAAPSHHPVAPSTHTASAASGHGEHLRQLKSPQRLMLRRQPAYWTLRHATELANCLHSARGTVLDLVRDLEHDLAFQRVVNSVRHRKLARRLASLTAGAYALGPGLDIQRALDFGLGGRSAQDRTGDLELKRALKRVVELARALELTLLDRDGDLDRSRDLTMARALANSLIGRALARAHALEDDLTLARDLAVAGAREAVFDAARDFALPLDLDPDLDLALQELRKLGALLTELGDNFVGVDLRAAEPVDPGDLTGVRWSLTTIWPPDWEATVRRVSVEIAPGIFEVSGNGSKRSMTEVGT